MQINIEDILALAGRTIFQRGVDYFYDSRVLLTHIDDTGFEAVVDGTFLYHVDVNIDKDGIHAACDCPYQGFCKHIVAALLEAREYVPMDEESQPVPQKNTWRQHFSQIAREQPENRLTEHWELIYILEITPHSWNLIPRRQYIKKDGTKGRVLPVQDIEIQDFTLNYQRNDPMIIAYLKRPEARAEKRYYQQAYGYRNTRYELAPFQFGQNVGALLSLMKNSRIYTESETDGLIPVVFDPEPCAIRFSFQETAQGYALAAGFSQKHHDEFMDKQFLPLTSNPVYLFNNNTLIEVKEPASAEMLILWNRANQDVIIPKSEFPAFVKDVYPNLAGSESIEFPPSIPQTVLSEMTEKRLNLSENREKLHIHFLPVYGETVLSSDDHRLQQVTMQNNSIHIINRDMDAETEAQRQLIESGLKLNKDGSFTIGGNRGMDWFFEALPKLKQAGFTINGWSQLKKYKIRTGTPKVELKVSSRIDWFDLNLNIDIEGIQLSIKELRKSIRLKSRFIKLEDGSFGRLNDEWISRFKQLFQFAQMDEGQIKTQQFHATLIDQLFSSAQSIETDEDYEWMLKRLSTFQGIEKQAIPETLEQTLRPYQTSGVNWLYFLQEYGFGGCLADDMGLGKTLQTLTVLLKDKMDGETGPSLIVCPTSVVFNWQKEIEKFTPDLSVYMHTGIKRQKEPSFLKQHNVVLTSYGILMRDIELLKSIRFHYVILDESQKIKNPSSQSSKAVRLLESSHRLALTGTPVENNTTELYSQFAFLNPGFFGSLNNFRHNFTIPIEKHGEHQAAKMLQKIIYPFILRRTKKHVATELPDKVEQTCFCPMSPGQEKLYQHWKDYYRGMLLNKIDDMGFQKSRMHVLEGLVKLRQIACHPELIDADQKYESGKMETLKEYIDEITAEGHKILVFSQFVKMLKIIRKFCDNNNYRYAYLDGRTRKREACVNQFQTDNSIKLFLISLKAGGTGLNLTAADYVIHVDPWWNPAVEAQATDRAHRIGQDKKVIVYKLISRNTVEEKMLALQERKQALVRQLIGSDTGFMKSLTREDVEILFS